MSQTPLVSYIEFYNSTLDHIDLMKEYLTWQSPDSKYRTYLRTPLFIYPHWKSTTFVRNEV